jgi:hypothetical protein
MVNSVLWDSSRVSRTRQVRVLAMAAIVVLQGRTTRAQSSGPEYPKELIKGVWHIDDKYHGRAYRFYPDGIFVVQVWRDGSTQPSTTNAFRWGRWFVRYPSAPKLNPHELCKYAPLKKETKANARCSTFILEGDAMMWSDLLFSRINQHSIAASDLRQFDDLHAQALREEPKS